MFWIKWILFLMFVIVIKNAQSQRMYPASNYPLRRFHRPVHNFETASSPVAQNRHLHWVKHLKKQERHKFKKLKKQFRKCGFSYPYKFQLFRRSDNGEMDTIHIIVPYGYNGEYFPQPHLKENVSTELEMYNFKSTTTKPTNIYSVKYRNLTTETSHFPVFYQQYQKNSDWVSTNRRFDRGNSTANGTAKIHSSLYGTTVG